MPAVQDISSDISRMELLRLYKDHSDYDLVESIASADVFIKAGRMLLALPVRRIANSGTETEIEPRIVQEQVNAAVRWRHTRVAAGQPPRQFIPDPDWRGDF